jgi:hypothetical protein
MCSEREEEVKGLRSLIVLLSLRKRGSRKNKRKDWRGNLLKYVFLISFVVGYRKKRLVLVSLVELLLVTPEVIWYNFLTSVTPHN